MVSKEIEAVVVVAVVVEDAAMTAEDAAMIGADAAMIGADAAMIAAVALMIAEVAMIVAKRAVRIQSVRVVETGARRVAKRPPSVKLKSARQPSRLRRRRAARVALGWALMQRVLLSRSPSGSPSRSPSRNQSPRSPQRNPILIPAPASVAVFSFDPGSQPGLKAV